MSSKMVVFVYMSSETADNVSVYAVRDGGKYLYMSSEMIEGIYNYVLRDIKKLLCISSEMVESLVYNYHQRRQITSLWMPSEMVVDSLCIRHHRWSKSLHVIKDRKKVGLLVIRHG